MTPDSFSDGGRYVEVEAAVKRAIEIEREGAAILDIGAESTRPGSRRITEKQERARVLPILKALKKPIGIPFSIDTLHVGVARQAVELGARYINHIALDGEDVRTREIAQVARETGVHLILTHARGPLESMHTLPPMRDPVREVLTALKRLAKLAAGTNLLLDPGIGFGKDAAESYALLRSIDEIRALGWPVVVGASRKRFLSPDPKKDRAEDRDFATAATVAYCVAKGCDIVRIHNVKAMSQVVQVAARLCG